MMEVIANKGSAPTGKKITREELEKLRKEDARIVKGIFRCHEPSGGSVTLVWRQYKGDPIRRWTLQDGMQYDIPLGLAKHLNNNCSRYEHGHLLDAAGNPYVDRRHKTVSRMNFESTEYYG